MGLRIGRDLSFTIALAFIDQYVEGVKACFAIKAAVAHYLAERLDPPAVLRINTLDDPAASDERGGLTGDVERKATPIADG